MNKEKEVYFDQYCKNCKLATAFDKDGLLTDKCEECLDNPSNTDSHKPINFKEKK